MTEKQEALYCAGQAKAQIEAAHKLLADACVNLECTGVYERHPVLLATRHALQQTGDLLKSPSFNVFDLVKEIAK